MVKQYIRENWKVIAFGLYAIYFCAGIIGARVLSGTPLYQPAKHIFIGVLVGLVLGVLAFVHVRRKSART